MSAAITTGCSCFACLATMRATRSSRVIRTAGEFATAWSRSISDRSLRSVTSNGCAGAASLLPTEGNSISPGEISGAVTMKITSSTSITSM